jgi:hypothetical protein
VRKSQGCDRVVSLLVGNDENDVRALHGEIFLTEVRECDFKRYGAENRRGPTFLARKAI